MVSIDYHQRDDGTDMHSFDKLAVDTDIVGYPVLPLVEQLTKMVPAEHAKYIHWGATTQDIQDSATMLQMKQGLDLVRRQTIELIRILERLAHKHRDTYVIKEERAPSTTTQ